MFLISNKINVQRLKKNSVISGTSKFIDILTCLDSRKKWSRFLNHQNKYPKKLNCVLAHQGFA